MAKYVGECLNFDKVYLRPKYSDIESRSSIDLSMRLDKDRVLQLPIIAAPMDTVCESAMAIALGNAGGLGIIHRYMPLEDQLVQIRKTLIETSIVGFAVGSVNDGKNFHRASAGIAAGAKVVLVDVAHGHHKSAAKMVGFLRDRYQDNIHVMCGNVATAEGFKYLENAGAHSVRVGVAGGSVCETRLVTGHGMPTLESLRRVREAKNYTGNCKIIADGGIKNSGDIVKCFAFGADAVMLGSMLAGTDEAPGEITDNGKVYRGMASADAQMDWRGKVSVAEGKSTCIPPKGPVEFVLEQIKGGLRSGCSYSGVDKLSNIYEDSEYVIV